MQFNSLNIIGESCSLPKPYSTLSLCLWYTRRLMLVVLNSKKQAFFHFFIVNLIFVFFPLWLWFQTKHLSCADSPELVFL